MSPFAVAKDSYTNTGLSAGRNAVVSVNMDEITGDRSSSGVFIAENFRDNLIIDRYDPCFASMRASKLKHLRSENSEDVLSWNVFRSLSKISPLAWVSLLAEHAFEGIHQHSDLKRFFRDSIVGRPVLV